MYSESRKVLEDVENKYDKSFMHWDSKIYKINLFERIIKDL